MRGNPAADAYDYPGQENAIDIDLRKFFAIIKRRRKIIINTVILVLALALVFLFLQTSRYTSDSVLQFNLREQQVVDIKSVIMGLPSDEAAISSELDTMRSRYIIGRVYDKMDLENNEQFYQEFSRAPEEGSSFFGLFSADDSELQHDKKVRKLVAIDNVMKRLSIDRKPRSYTVKIRFTSESPELSALITNAIIDEYLLNEVEMQYDVTKRANDWLKVRVEELQEKVRESENAVQKFREENNLIKSSGTTVNEKQLDELNSQLVLAHTELAQAKARLEQSKEISAENNNVESAPDIINSTLIQRLREQEAMVMREKSELESRYGPRHPLMVKIKAQLDDLRAKITSESKKIVGGLEYGVEIAQSKVDALEKNLEELQKESGVTNRAEVKLAELERQMETDRALYESFLARFKETSQQNLEQNIVTVISRAEVPLKPSWPDKKLIMLVAGLMGIGLGLILALVSEHFNNSFYTTEQVEEVLAVPAIGMIPELEHGQGVDITKYAVDNPISAFAESLRAVMASVYFSNPDNPPKTIMITSSVPKEGKSSFSISLARIAAASGSKVLLVDCDMRRPTVGRAFDKSSKKGLEEMLIGKAKVSDIIAVDKETGLHYIKSGANTHYSQELLGSRKMKEFVDKMVEKYDHVILDSPPVMALSDALMLSRIADTAVVMVRWEKTAHNIARNAIKRLRSTGVPIAGTVLSRVDLKKHEKYGFSEGSEYYGHYKDYYTSG